MISIIVPIYNEIESIKNFLKILKKEMKKEDFEVIIIDSSTDNTHNLAKKVKGIYGKTYVGFTVDSKGKVTNLRIFED